jgi:hypothetical protein
MVMKRRERAKKGKGADVDLGAAEGLPVHHEVFGVLLLC